MKETSTLKRSEMMFFGAADLFGGGGGALIAAVYMSFLLVNGVTIAQAGIIVGVSRIWDAIIDPPLGVITDNTRTKYGRRRPFIFCAGVLIPFALAILFMPLYKMNDGIFKVVIYLCSFILFNTISSTFAIPYASMSAEISDDYYIRTKANQIRLIFSMIASAIVAGVGMPLADALLDENNNFRVNQFVLIVVIGFGVLFCIPVILAAVKCKERVDLPEEKSKFDIKTFLKPLRVKAFIYLLLIYFCGYACMDIITANLVIFAKYGLAIEIPTLYMLVAIMGSYAVMVPLLIKGMDRGMPKPKLVRMGIPLYIGGAICLCLMPGSWPDYIALVFCVIIGVGTSGCQYMPWLIFPDVADAAKLKYADMSPGTVSGLMSLIRTSSSAVALAGTSFILSATGFVEPKADLDGLAAAVTQPQSAIWGLRLVVMISIIVFISIVYFAAKKLKLTPERSKKITEFISIRDEGGDLEQSLSAEDREIYAGIKKDLF
ncbi:MAG: MFS transporter [Oscillospiraceae bacterium]|nr:MFS transporter [Oscillospiraceae bacterium]